MTRRSPPSRNSPACTQRAAKLICTPKNCRTAEREFRFELQVDARSEEAWLGLANTQLAANQPAAARESLRRVWEISPEFLAVQGLPGTSLDQQATTLRRGSSKHLLAPFQARRARDRMEIIPGDFLGRNIKPQRYAVRILQGHRYSRCKLAAST